MLRRLDERLLVAALCVALAAGAAALVGLNRSGLDADRAADARAPIGAQWAARVAWGRP
jgi:hypothetical protein